MKKLLMLIAMCASMIFGAVGPVSQYGQLITGKNSSGKGQIYGSCEGVKDGSEVQVRGMSLYWSLLDKSVDFWDAGAITKMVSDMKIQIVRAAMATGDENWSDGKYLGYEKNPDQQTGLVDKVVQAAIDNDIYVIIDFHSHKANNQVETAKKFFTYMAQKWGKYDNVIFEIFNEPEAQSWNDVKTYANQIIPVIRQYSDNLILVGNPSWDQNPQMAIGNEVTDSKHNTAYTMHYYAMSHSYGQDNSPGKNALTAMNAGLSVFVSEWGTGTADGDGSPTDSKNNGWQNYLNLHKLSWANWSASAISEGTAAFNSGSNAYNFSYTTSGNMVKGYLSSNPTSYTKCGSLAVQPDPTSSSSSQQQWQPQSSSSIPCEWTITCGTTAINRTVPKNFNRTLVGIYDITGHVLKNTDTQKTYIEKYSDGTVTVIRK